jgi:hypothetical protein
MDSVLLYKGGYMSTKEIKKDAASTWRGFVKFLWATIGVVEAFAWLGLIGTGWTLVYRNLKAEISLNDIVFYAVFLSTTVITFRLVYEGKDYFKRWGEEYER